MSEEGGVDGFRTGFGSLVDGGDNKPKAALLLFVACVEANRNVLSDSAAAGTDAAGLSELLASNDNIEGEDPVLSLPSSGGLTSI